MKKKITLLLLLVSMPILFSQCASRTIINSTPQGAEVFVNGEFRGTTPYEYSDTKIMFSTTSLTLKKSGFEEMHVMLQRNESVDVGPIIGGFFFWPAWLWSMKYNENHHYKLTPQNK